ncbi:MAG: antitoxin Xre/MbcA/ParS toxin-binding domain-containing protein [Pseudomonadota bacterium]
MDSVADELLRSSPYKLQDLLKFGFSKEEIHAIVAPRRTIERRKSKKELLTVAETDRLKRLERVFEMAERVLGQADKANRWLRKSNRALDGHVPMDLLKSESGARMVEDVLHAIDYGMYS